jgi:hypothetical protein
MLVRQALYHLSHSASDTCLKPIKFWDSYTAIDNSYRLYG